MATRYYRTPWGAQAIAADPDDVFTIPSDWENIDAGTYASITATINGDPAGWAARVANDACQARKDAFQDLHSTIPALDLETCYLLSGWKPGDC